MSQTRILLVDDEVEFILALAERLQLRKYDVRTAGSSPEALSLIKDQSPDVVILDLTCALAAQPQPVDPAQAGLGEQQEAVVGASATPLANDNPRRTTLVCPLREINILVSDQAPAGALAAALRQSGVQVITPQGA